MIKLTWKLFHDFCDLIEIVNSTFAAQRIPGLLGELVSETCSYFKYLIKTTNFSIAFYDMFGVLDCFNLFRTINKCRCVNHTLNFNNKLAVSHHDYQLCRQHNKWYRLIFVFIIPENVNNFPLFSHHLSIWDQQLHGKNYLLVFEISTLKSNVTSSYQLSIINSKSIS